MSIDRVFLVFEHKNAFMNIFCNGFFILHIVRLLKNYFFLQFYLKTLISLTCFFTFNKNIFREIF